MDKKKLGAISFVAGLAIGAASNLLNKQNREVVKSKATDMKKSTSELGGKVKDKVKDTVTTIGNTVETKVKNVQSSQPKGEQEEVTLMEEVMEEIASSDPIEETIPEQLDVASEPEKELALGNEEVTEEAEELLEGNGDILVK